MKLVIKTYNTSGPIKGVSKQSAIWGSNGTQTSPIVYLQRPKWIKDDACWDMIVKSISINLPYEYEIK